MYRRVHLPRWLDKMVYSVLRMPMIFFSGYFGTWVPLRKEVTVVYGHPIEVALCAEPSDAQVAAVLEQFMTAQKQMFATFSRQIGMAEDEVMVVVDAKKVTGVKSKGGDSKAKGETKSLGETVNQKATSGTATGTGSVKDEVAAAPGAE